MDKLHHFVLQPDGVIGWIENMPEEPPFPNTADFVEYKDYNEAVTNRLNAYNAALQSAIDSATEVVNFDETEDALLDAHATGHGFRLERNKPYPLQCHVEKKETPDNRDGKLVALVTFSEPSAGVEETQEYKCIHCNGTGYSNKPPLGQ